MASTFDDLKARGMDQVIDGLFRAGYTPKSLLETKRDVLWWGVARAEAVRYRRPLQAGSGIAWTSAGYAELVPIDVPRPGRGRVSVLVEISAVSPGTERAQYLKLPNTAVGAMGRPGYSSAGFVREVGPGVDGLTPGMRVAVVESPHASLLSVPASQVFPIPDDLSLERAALVHLGVICRQGVKLGELDDNEGFAVVGAGPIGALALRLAALKSEPLAVIAASRAKEADALRGGAKRFLTVDETEEIEALSAPVVFEATGNPDAIATAVAAAAPGGRVVLLGSPRGITKDFPVDAIQRKRIEIVGAHIDTTKLEAVDGENPRRRHAVEFLREIGGQEIYLDDLIGPALDPQEAPLFYEALSQQHDIVGAHFDWSRLPAHLRASSASLFRPPNVLGRGMDAKRPLRRGSIAPDGPFDLGDQLAGAAGELRLGLIGCGDISTHNAGGIAAAPNCRLVACFDPVKRLAEDLASSHNAAVADSAEELFDRDDVDAVVIAVPHHLHAPIAEAAIAAGKHVVVEKPQANNLAAAVRMNEAAEKAGVILSVCFPQRYDPAVVITRRLIEQGALGQIEGANIRLYLDKTPAYWLGGFSGRAKSDWRRSKERAGGGVLIMNLPHHLDLIRHLGDLEADVVVATGSGARPSPEIENSISLGITYKSGAVGNLSGYSAVRGTTEDDFSIWGDSGHVMVTPSPRLYTMRPVAGMRTSRWQSFGKLPGAKMRAVYFARLGTAISEEAQPDITGADGIAVQAIIEAAYRSAESRAAERPEDLIGAESS